ASSVGPSTTAMKSNGPVTASRLTTVEPPPSIAASSFFTAFVLPGAVSIRTYARIFFAAPFVMSHPYLSAPPAPPAPPPPTAPPPHAPRPPAPRPAQPPHPPPPALAPLPA